jgi:hypothetical protein
LKYRNLDQIIVTFQAYLVVATCPFEFGTSQNFQNKMNRNFPVYCITTSGGEFQGPGSGMAHGPDVLMHDVRGGSMRKAQCELELFLLTESFKRSLYFYVTSQFREILGVY